MPMALEGNCLQITVTTIFQRLEEHLRILPLLITISAKEQMLNNYLQHQEWPHFSDCLYKSSQGPGLRDTEEPGRELPREKNPKVLILPEKW